MTLAVLIIVALIFAAAAVVKAREAYLWGLVRRAAAGDRAAVDKIRRLNRKRGGSV